MTSYGTEIPDLTDGDMTIRPSNAEAIGFVPVAKHSAESTGDSALDQLLGLADEVISNIVRFPVKSRKGNFVLEFDAVISEPDIKRYRAASMKKRKRPEDADMSVGNAMAIHEKNVGIYQEINGELKKIADTDGIEDLIINSTTFVTSFGKGANVDTAVRKFLGDAETNTIGAAVLKAAGWGEDLEPLDPTDA